MNELMSASITTVTHVEIHVICSERLQGLFQSGLDVRLIRIPDLRGDEDLLPFETAILDTLTDFVLILVDECAVKVSVTGSKCLGDGLSHFSWFCLPGAW